MSKINLGICGSGQLSMMLCQAAKKLGVNTIVLTNDENGPAKKYCDEYFYCDLKEIKNLKSFANKIDVSTLEFENFDYHLLKEIEKIKPFYPKPEINKIVQNRILEKNFFKSLEIPITEYAVIKKRADIKENGHLLPGILKSAIGGYDGHLSYQINSSKDLDTISLDPTKEYILEKKVNLEKEISIIGTRYKDGKINFFHPFENIHRDQILRETFSPAKISSNIENLAKEYSSYVIKKHDYIGTMAIEFFINKDGELLANETASRVHNSGHITMSNFNSSQFDQHIRAVCNLDFKKI